jgi:hypothetical protein
MVNLGLKEKRFGSDPDSLKGKLGAEPGIDVAALQTAADDESERR